jgi:cytoskeleton protein RodZ
MSAMEARMETDVERPLPPATPAPDGPGAALRKARERAGLSLDQVAQQLKLAPRQVKALEDEDFGQLPGRTFARGFVRNYARLLNLDSDHLLAQLPDATLAPALASPLLQSTGTTIGEVPTTRVVRPAATRWLIPLVLVACIVGAGAYEWYRSGMSLTKRAEPASPTAAVQPTKPPAGTAQTELPNPLSGAPAADPAPAENRTPASPAPPSPAAAARPSASVQPSSAAATSSAPTAAPAVAEAPPSSAVAEPPAPLVLTYRGPSWTDVRDSRGQVLLTRLVPAGSEQQIRGTAPFDVTIGNARAVTLVYRGKQIDLTRYTHQNIARLRLP